MLVKTISINTGDSDHRQILGVRNTVYFIGSDATRGAELWKTDGAALGTVLVKDIYPGAGPGIPSGNAGTGLVAIGNTVYFRAGNDTHGFALWKSDGTEAGTVQLSSIYPANNSAAASFKEVNGTIFFSADDGTNGIELWSLASPLLAVDPPVASLIERLELSPADPNPASSNTRITFTLPISKRGTLRLFDVRGRAVRTLVEGEQAVGRHSMRLDARGLSSGVYFLKLEASSIVRQRKVVVQR